MSLRRKLIWAGGTRGSAATETLYIVLFDGQSNSVGACGNGEGGVVATPDPLSPGGLMFNGTKVGDATLSTGPGAPRNQNLYDWSNTTGFEASREVSYNAQGQTWQTDFMHGVRMLSEERGLGINHIFCHAIGAGGQTIAELNPPANASLNAKEALRRACQYARANGWNIDITISWSQGEAQYSNTVSEYKTSMLTRIAFYNDEMLPIARQYFPSAAPFKILIEQLSVRGSAGGTEGLNTEIGQATLELSLENSQVFMGIPQYIIDKAPAPGVGPDATDTYHFATFRADGINKSYAGNYLAYSYAHLIENGSLPFVRIVKCETSDNRNFTCTVTSNPTSQTIIEMAYPPLRIDGNEVVPTIAGGGCMFDDVAVQCDTPVITSDTSFTFGTNQAPVRGSTFLYALSQPGQTKPNSKGNLRDSRPGYAWADPTLPCPNFAMNTFMPITYNVGDNPEDVSGLVAWFRADTGITESGGRATAWAVKSGSSSIAFPTAGKQPIVDATALNSLPGLYFNSVRQDYGTWSGTFPPGDWTVFFIGREDSSVSVTGNSHVFSTMSSGAGRRTFYLNSTQAATSVIQDNVSTATRIKSKATGYVAGTSILFMAQSYSNTGDRLVYAANSGQDFDPSSSALTGTYTPSSAISIGTTSGSTTGNLSAWIGDIIIYNRLMYGNESNLIDYLTIQNYATQRYGFAPLLD